MSPAKSARSVLGLWLGCGLALPPLAWGMGMLASTRTWGFSVGLALAAIALAWGALHWGYSAPAPSRRAWFVVPVVLLWLWVLFRDAACDVPDAARWDALKWTAILGMGLLWRHYARAGAARLLLAALLVLVFCESLYGIFQHVNHSTKVLWMQRPSQYGLRVSSTFLCPNHFANIVSMAIPMAVAILCARGVGLPLRMLGGYTLLVALPALYWTESRSAWLGLLAGLGVVALGELWRRSWKAFVWGLIGVPLLAAALVWTAWATLPQVRHRVDQMIEGRESGDFGGSGRLKMWRDTLEMWKSNPVLGYGGGSFQWVFPPWQNHARLNLLYDYPHNEYVQVLAEYGAVGLGLVALVLLAGGIETLARVRRRDSDADTPSIGPEDDAGHLLVGAAGAAASCAVHACFDFNFHIFPNPHFLVAFVGIAWGVSDAARARSPAAIAAPESCASRWTRRLLAPVLALAALACGAWAVTGGLSYWFCVRGRMAVDPVNGMGWLNYDIAEPDFHRAIAWDSLNADPWLSLGNLARDRAFWCRDPEEKQRLVAEALDAYQNTLRLNPHQALARYGIGCVQRSAGNPEAARESLLAAVAQNPFHFDLRRKVARELRLLGYEDDARDMEVLPASRKQ